MLLSVKPNILSFEYICPLRARRAVYSKMAGSRNNGFWIAHTLIQDLNTYNTGFQAL